MTNFAPTTPTGVPSPLKNREKFPDRRPVIHIKNEPVGIEVVVET
jgi:hypothetical protein